MNDGEQLRLDDEPFDGELPPFATLLEALGDIDDVDADDDAVGQSMDVDRISLSLSIELAVRPDADGRVRVGGSTPTQWTATTIMPAFHKLTMHIAREPHGEE